MHDHNSEHVPAHNRPKAADQQMLVEHAGMCEERRRAWERYQQGDQAVAEHGPGPAGGAQQDADLEFIAIWRIWNNKQSGRSGILPDLAIWQMMRSGKIRIYESG